MRRQSGGGGAGRTEETMDAFSRRHIASPSTPIIPVSVPSTRSTGVVPPRFHAEARRSAEARRTALGVELLEARTAPLHPGHQRLGGSVGEISAPCSAPPRDMAIVADGGATLRASA